MADAAGRINTLQVRCPCGKSFKNAKMYLEHRWLCEIHLEARDTISLTSNSSRSVATISTGASIPASTPRPIASVAHRYGSTLQNHEQLQKHGCYCAPYTQQMNERLAALHPVQDRGPKPGADWSLAAGRNPIPPVEAATRKLLCPCEQSFTNESRLEEHSRYSKTRQAGKSESGATPKGTTPVLAPFTAPYPSPTSTCSPSKPVPGIVPSSALPITLPVFCTYGYALATQRVLELHKRSYLHHSQQADESLTQSQRSSSLVSSFASLDLKPVLMQAEPLEARFTCMCGCTYTTQEGLEQHKKEKRRSVWPKEGARKEKLFKTPRPKYQEDAYLREICAALAQQNCDEK